MNYQVSGEYTSYSKTASNVEDCQFNVLLENEFYDSLNISFGVSYQKKTGSMNLTSYFVESENVSSSNVVVVNYNGNNGGELDMGTCQLLSESEIESESCQSAIAWSVSQFNEQVESGFSLSSIQSVYQDVVNTNNYRVVATLKNKKGTMANCVFSVNYGEMSGASNSMNSASYYLY